MKARCAVSGSGSPNADNGFAEKKAKRLHKTGCPRFGHFRKRNKNRLVPDSDGQKKILLLPKKRESAKDNQRHGISPCFFCFKRFFCPAQTTSGVFSGRLLPHVLFCGKKIFRKPAAFFLRAFLSVGKRDGRFFYAMKTAAISAAEANGSNQNRTAE